MRRKNRDNPSFNPALVLAPKTQGTPAAKCKEREEHAEALKPLLNARSSRPLSALEVELGLAVRSHGTPFGLVLLLSVVANAHGLPRLVERLEVECIELLMVLLWLATRYNGGELSGVAWMYSLPTSKRRTRSRDSTSWHYRYRPWQPRSRNHLRQNISCHGCVLGCEGGEGVPSVGQPVSPFQISGALSGPPATSWMWAMAWDMSSK